MGSSSSNCSCLIIVSAYGAAVSLAFTIVTVLYATQESLECGDVVSGDNSEKKALDLYMWTF